MREAILGVRVELLCFRGFDGFIFWMVCGWISYPGSPYQKTKIRYKYPALLTPKNT